MSRHGQPLDIRPAALALLALLGLALALPATALAADPVGRIIARSGGVSAIDADGDRRRLDRRDPVYAGDTIRTGPRGRAQIRFVDSGMVDLEPRTRFGIDEYRQEQDGGNVVLNFLAGALRAVTGAIGEREEDEYRMNTPVATIGVRGTAYALRWCDADCAEETGDRAGLYGRVEDDFIVVDTPAGSASFGEGEYFYVPEGGPPEGIVAPPDGILDGGDDAPGGDTTDLPDVGVRPAAEDRDDPFAGQPGEDIIEPDFDEVQASRTSIVGATAAAAGLSDGNDFTLWAASAFGEEGNFSRDSQGRLISGDLSSGGADNSFGDPTTVEIANVTLAEVGSVDSLSIGWGRWEGTLTASDGTNEVAINGNLAFTITDNLTSPDTLSDLSGTLSYTLAGGPSAFDQNGALWTVGALELAADFTSGSIDLVQFDLSQNVGQLSFSFASGDQQSSNLDLQNNSFGLQVDIAGTRDGTLSGEFVGVNADGATVVFTVRDRELGTLVSGTSVLLAQ